MSEGNPEYVSEDDPGSLERFHSPVLPTAVVPNPSLSSLRDPAVQKKLVEIIEAQFDLEILMKRREISLIEQRVSQGQELLAYLVDAISNGGNSLYSGRLRPKSIDMESRRLTITRSQSMIDTTRDVDSTFRGNNGKFYKCKCCYCGRGEFRNILGLHNHIIGKHNKSFGRLAVVRFRCQYEVNEAEIPADHPCRTAPPVETEMIDDFNTVEFPMAEPIPEPPPSLAKIPAIRIFEEEIHFDDDHQMTTINTSEKMPESPPMEEYPMSESESPLPQPINTVFSESIDSNLSKELSIENTVELNIPTQNENTPIETQDPMDTEANSDENEEDMHETENTILDHLRGESKTIEKDEFPPLADCYPSPSVHSTGETLQIPAPVSSMVSSRYHVIHPLILGNLSYYIPQEKRTHPMLLYKWKLFLNHQDDSVDISTFIKKVRFFLHPSFSPHDIVDVVKPPFSLTRKGWGECPLRLLIFFRSEKQKPLNLFHTLKLHARKPGKWTTGSERIVQVELDKRLFDKANQDTEKGPSESNEASSEEEESNTPKPTESPITDSLESNKDVMKHFSLNEFNHHLIIAAKAFPITEQAALLITTPLLRNYRLTSSSDEFLKISFVKRYTIEWLRARKMKKLIESNLKKSTKTILPSTRQILHWNRENGYTPGVYPVMNRSIDNNNSNKVEEKSVGNELPLCMACKYCGRFNDVKKLIDSIEMKRMKRETDKSKKIKHEGKGEEDKMDQENLMSTKEQEEEEEEEGKINAEVTGKPQGQNTLSEAIELTFHQHQRISQMALLYDEMESSCLLKRHLAVIRGKKRRPRRCATITPADEIYQKLQKSTRDHFHPNDKEGGDEELIDVEILQIDEGRKKSDSWREIEIYCKPIDDGGEGESVGLLSVPIDRNRLQFVQRNVHDLCIPLGLDAVETLDEGIISGNLIAEAMKAFLKRTIETSVKLATSLENTHDGMGWSNADGSTPDQLLTPYHIFLTLAQTPTCDFLTSQYFGQILTKKVSDQKD